MRRLIALFALGAAIPAVLATTASAPSGATDSEPISVAQALQSADPGPSDREIQQLLQERAATQQREAASRAAREAQAAAEAAAQQAAAEAAQKAAEEAAAKAAAEKAAAEKAAAAKAAAEKAAAEKAARDAAARAAANRQTPVTTGGAGGTWAALRNCESGGNYATNTGNGYYGAYQFSAQTWHAMGYSGLPSDASAATQDAAAQALQARSGWGQWPACARKLGLI